LAAERTDVDADQSPSAVAGSASESAQLDNSSLVQGAQLVAMIQAEVAPRGVGAIKAFDPGAQVGEMQWTQTRRRCSGLAIGMDANTQHRCAPRLRAGEHAALAPLGQAAAARDRGASALVFSFVHANANAVR
jgi:hypothetical protein